MNSKPEGVAAYWFLGAAYGGTDDQTSRFLREGIWENRQDRYHDQVKSIQVGDRVAIKSSYTRKNDLPFDNQGQTVAVMGIKAIGTVKENLGDGRTLKVDWKPVAPLREWYFYTNRGTVWRVLSGDWMTDALIEFTFEGKAQDINRFRNDRGRFTWTRFYEEVANGLLAFRHRRDELIAGIRAIESKVDVRLSLQDRFDDGSSGPLRDICPFTAMAIFNGQHNDANRRVIASELASLLGVTEPGPDSFEGIPIHSFQWFFDYDNRRLPDDIDTVWEAFVQAIAFVDTALDDARARAAFIAAYDDAIQRNGVKWNLTFGLFWIRPWHFLSLDKHSRRYIGENLDIQIGNDPPKGRDYLAMLDTLEARFQEDGYPVRSFPELSLAARIPPITPPDYSIECILRDGCFVDRGKLEVILKRLRTKKNLILQGPPGTGKSWLAKRLAFALIGQRDQSKIRAVQFHPNLSYEDFIRGWRPTGDGKLTLVDGPFVEIMKAAERDPTSNYVIVIEEINRGNPAQIFGEMMTLLEVDKRTRDEALELSYKQSDGERVFIPPNLHVIGTMNIADRSLALVDLALRRRFAFIDLEPVLGQPWRDWVRDECGIDAGILVEIERRLLELNDNLAGDSNLGPQFRVGHSYVTPPSGVSIGDAREWFRQVVDTEIGPLLDEYWFDALEKAQRARERLLEGF